MSESQTCSNCAHLEERVSRRWFWCDKNGDWTSLSTTCADYTPAVPGGQEAPPVFREVLGRGRQPGRKPDHA